jgi:phospholipid/cholesterol/gamma-HCH transport system substrate-binding protein
METHARYALIGSFMLACILAGFAFVYWTANTGGIGARTVYAAVFNEPVSGLMPGASVLFNGVRVGAVSVVELDSQDPKKVTVLISVQPSTPIKSDTLVGVSFQGLTGTPAISLKGGTPDAPPLASANGQPALLRAPPGGAESLTEAARMTLKRLDTAIDENAKPLNTAVTGIAAFADMLGRNSERVETLLASLEGLLGGGKNEPAAIYDLDAPANIAGLEGSIKGPLVVADVTAPLVFDSQKIYSRTASGTFTALNNAQWADTIPKLVQAKLVQTFENAHQIEAVNRPVEQLTPEFRLEVSVRAFHINRDNTARIELAARLFSEKDGLQAANMFSDEVKADSGGATDLVKALNQAFGRVSSDIVKWTMAHTPSQ